jgi:hypothetical protein
MRSKRFLLALGLILSLTAATGDDAAMSLARQVVNASGGADWPKVSRVKFTFNVESDGKVVMSAKHDWDVRAGTDAVAWNDKNVTVHLMDKNDSGDARAGFARWTNDSYWLLAPIKLLDGGVKLESGGSQDVEGTKYDVLKVSFEHVGMTPGDRYNLYIDPAAHLIRRWDYMPSADKKVSGTWEKYQKFGPLNLATEHAFGGKRIYFTDVSVETDR